jgi:hypothetical protein
LIATLICSGSFGQTATISARLAGSFECQFCPVFWIFVSIALLQFYKYLFFQDLRFLCIGLLILRFRVRAPSASFVNIDLTRTYSYLPFVFYKMSLSNLDTRRKEKAADKALLLSNVHFSVSTITLRSA